MRTLVWFSCGVASTVCAYLYKDDPDAVFVYCDTGGEHPDNKRFLADVEKLIGRKIQIIRNVKYKDHIDVCEKERYINGPTGARCTTELKKIPRYAIQLPDDIQVFGYTSDEANRAESFNKAFPEVKSKYPLIEKGWTKAFCLQLIDGFKLEMPIMYRLGFANNNCIGCVKGGMGYWNKIREHFPETFERMARVERIVGHSCINGRFLDELKPGEGRDLKESDMTCDFLCQITVNEIKKKHSERA